MKTLSLNDIYWTLTVIQEPSPEIRRCSSVGRRQMLILTIHYRGYCTSWATNRVAGFCQDLIATNGPLAACAAVSNFYLISENFIWLFN
jgi:hypothetical protein